MVHVSSAIKGTIHDIKIVSPLILSLSIEQNIFSRKVFCQRYLTLNFYFPDFLTCLITKFWNFRRFCQLFKAKYFWLVKFFTKKPTLGMGECANPLAWRNRDWIFPFRLAKPLKVKNRLPLSQERHIIFPHKWLSRRGENKISPWAATNAKKRIKTFLNLFISPVLHSYKGNKKFHWIEQHILQPHLHFHATL